MSMTLKPKHEQLIQAQLASGNFANADEAIDAAFQLLENMGDDYAQWVKETREKVDIAIAECDRGETLDGETVVNQILDRFQHAREAQQ